MRVPKSVVLSGLLAATGLLSACESAEAVGGDGTMETPMVDGSPAVPGTETSANDGAGLLAQTCEAGGPGCIADHGSGAVPDAAPMSVLGTALQTCSLEPLTGFYRDGSCRTGLEDRGVHTVCAEVTDAFLDYTAGQGNDLRTPSPGARFPGLRPGDRWCLCASRWAQAYEAGVAPPVVQEATSDETLRLVPSAWLMPN